MDIILNTYCMFTHVKLSNLTNVTNAIESIIYKYGWLWL
jgi:hypothetical protein